MVQFERPGPHGHDGQECLRIPEMREPESSGPGVIETPSFLAETDAGYVQTASKLYLGERRHGLRFVSHSVAFCLTP